MKPTTPEFDQVAMSRKPLAKSPRPRFLRAFVRWLDGVRSRLLLPVRIVRIRSRCIELSIPVFGDCLMTSVYQRPGKGKGHTMSVRVHWNGDDVDGLLELDVNPRRTKGGYVCKVHLPEFAETYPTLEALWIARIFDAFLEFVNEKLATADCLAIHFHHGSSWASLTAADTNHGERCVAVVAR